LVKVVVSVIWPIVMVDGYSKTKQYELTGHAIKNRCQKKLMSKILFKKLLAHWLKKEFLPTFYLAKSEVSSRDEQLPHNKNKEHIKAVYLVFMYTL